MNAVVAVRVGYRILLLPVLVAALCLSAFGSASAGEHGEPRGGDFGHYRPHDGPGGHGGVSLWYNPGYYAPTYVAPAPVIVAPVIPAPEYISCSSGAVIQRTYYLFNGVVTYRDTIVQPAPVIVQPAPVIIQQDPTPTWVKIVSGIGVSVRW